jgi:tetratricopeptide (TPR) repeat protein
MKKSGGNAGAAASPGLRATWIGVALAAFAFALYLPSLQQGFVNWDDFYYITANPHLGRFDLAYLQWSFTTWWVLNWHPLTWISYGIDHAVWGKDAFGFHLTNVLLHAANTFLVFALGQRLFRRETLSTGATLAGAAVVAALFAVHPLHVESVAWVSERKDMLYTIFTLLALLAYLRYTQAEPKARLLAYAATLGLFALSALAKPMAVTFPAVLLLLDAWPLGRLGDAANRTRVAVVEKLPFVAISLGLTWLTVAAQQEGGALKTGELSLFERLFVAVKALGFYLAKLVAPITLVPLYPLESEITPLRWDYLLALLAVVAISTAAVVWRRRAPILAAGWAFYLNTLLPVLGIVQVGAQAAADRYMYLPILGPLAIVGAAAATVWDARPALRGALAAIAALVMVALGARTIVQIGVWRDSITLWEHVLAVYPGSVTAHYNLGTAFLEHDDFRKSEEWLRRAIELDPQHAMALEKLGDLAGTRGSPNSALRYYLTAIEASPTSALPHYKVARVYEHLRESESARRHYEAFLELAPPEFALRVAEVRRKLWTW